MRHTRTSVILLLLYAFSVAEFRKESLLESELFNRWIPRNREHDDAAFKSLVHNVKSRQTNGQLIPLVIVPSLIGSQLEAKLDGAHSKHWWCWSNADWYSIWINIYQFYPKFIECWLENIKLGYNPADNSYKPPTGVSVRAVDFGGVDGVAYLDQDKTIGLWNYTISILTALGYTTGINIRAAAYDWRVGADGLSGQFKDLKNLIEDTYVLNNNTKVATVSLSMGGPYFMLFLNTYVDSSWKEKFIHSFTSWSGPFGGSTFAVTAAASLMELLPNSTGVSPIDLRATVGSWGSIMWLFPTAQVFGDEVKVITPFGKYSPSNFTQLLLEVNMTVAAEVLRNSEKLRFVKAPGVRMNCVYGVGLDTLDVVTFTDRNLSQFDWKLSPGDQTVLDASLSVCKQWGSQQTEPVNVVTIPNMVHADAIHNPIALKVLIDTLIE